VADDFYALLEVPRDASQEEIRDAFREKVQIYHPDHNDDPRANAQFTALRKAYDTLGDPVERNAYDRIGHLDYVAKRLDGLPDPEKWAPSEAEEDSSVASESGSASTGSVGSSTSTGRSSGSTDSDRATARSPGGTASGGTASGRSAAGGSSGGGSSASGSTDGTASGRRTW